MQEIRLSFPSREIAIAAAVGLGIGLDPETGEPPADGYMPWSDEYFTGELYYNAIKWTPMLPTGETDPETGAPVLAPKPGFHIHAQIDVSRELAIPPDLMPFVASPDEPGWPVWG